MSDTAKTPETNKPTVSADARLAELQQRLNQLQDNLARERRRATRATTLTALLGIAALIALGVYFYIGYKAVAEVTEPDTVVTYAEGMLSENLPKARESLEEQIIKSAPSWAEGLSKQGQEAVPTVRKKATDRFIEEVDRMTHEAEILSEQHYRAYLRDNKPMLERKIKELETNPKLAEDSLHEMEIPWDKELGPEMKIDAAAISKDVASVTTNLKFLAANKGLTQEQQVERRVWMLARRLQMEQTGETGPTPATKPAPVKKAAPKPAEKPKEKGK